MQKITSCSLDGSQDRLSKCISSKTKRESTYVGNDSCSDRAFLMQSDCSMLKTRMSCNALALASLNIAEGVGYPQGAAHGGGIALAPLSTPKL